MAKRTINKDANWQTINTETLPTSIKDAYGAYKDAYRDMKECRQAFEDMVTKGINPPAGKRVIFGYNFGKLSVAIVDDDKPATRAPAGSVSLAALAMR